MKKTAALCALLMAVPFLQACTDSDAEALVAIGVIGWAWSDGGWHHDDHHDYNDHRDHRDHDRHGGYDNHGGYGNRGGHGHRLMPEAPEASDFSMSIALEETEPAQQMASDFGIQLSSAQSILAFTQGGSQAQERAAALGLSASDLAALVRLEMPSANAISKIAGSLGEDSIKIEQVARSYVSEVKAQLADVNSEYWQNCIESGHWATPQNSRCSQTYWNGCSPETGAMSCKIQ